MPPPRRLLLLFLAFFGLAVLFFAEPLLLGREFLRGDMGYFFYPQRAFFARSVLTGDFPLWNPLLFCGFPFLASPQNAVLYPPTWLFVAFPGTGTIWVILILHLAVAGTGAALLARESFEVEWRAAFCGGLVYAFSGFLCMHMGHFNQIMTCAWAPWVFWAAARWVKAPNPRSLSILAGFYGLQFLPGGAENTAHFSLALVGLAAAAMLRRSSGEGRGLSLGAGLIGAMALGVGLAGAQVVPTLELVQHSVRGLGITYDYVVRNSMPPYKPFVDLLLPNYWGHYGAAGCRLPGIPASELAWYTGPVAVALAVFAGVKGWRQWWVRYWSVVSVAALLLSFGGHTPLFRILYASSLSYFRNPSRFIILTVLGIAILAAAGVQRLLEPEEAILRSRMHRWVAPVFACAGGAVLLLLAAPWALASLEPGSFSRLITGDIAFGLLACGAAYGALATRPSRPRFVLLALAMGIPLFGFARESEFANLDATDAVRSTEERVFANIVSEALGQHCSYSYHCLPMRVNRNMLHGLPDVAGYDGGLYPLARYHGLRNQIAPESPLAVTKGRRFMDLLGARAVLDDGRLQDEEDGLLFRKGGLRAYVNLSAVPRAFFVAQGQVMSDEDAIEAMARGQWSPERAVLLASKPTFSGQEDEGSSQFPYVRITVDENDRLVCEVSADAAGFLVLHDSYFPGWEATVDGRPAEIVRANYLFRAVALVPGEHRVKFTYRPASLRAGIALSGISGLLLLLILVRRREQ